MIDTVLAIVFVILGGFVFLGMAKMDRDVNTPEGGNDMFIEITVAPNDVKLLLAKSHITVVEAAVTTGGSRIEITSDNGQQYYMAKETYEEIRKELLPVKEITVTIPGIADGGSLPTLREQRLGSQRL